MQQVSFPNSRGMRLAGVWHRAAGAAGAAGDRGRKPVLIICHGFRGGKDGSGRAVELGQKIAAAGYHVLRFDFAGTGDSEGEFAEITLSGYMADLSAAVNFTGEITAGPVVVLGRSFGGTTAVCQAAVDSRIAGVCVWAAPAALAETFEVPLAEAMGQFAQGDTMTVVDEAGEFSLRRSFFDDFANHDIYCAAGRISPRPFLIIHGKTDETVAVEQGRKLYHAAGQPRELQIIEGADHRFTRQVAEVNDCTEKWLFKYFSVD